MIERRNEGISKERERKNDSQRVDSGVEDGAGNNGEKNGGWMNNEPRLVSRDLAGYELRGFGAERHALKHVELDWEECVGIVRLELIELLFYWFLSLRVVVGSRDFKYY